jgi:hypothetical protein
MMVHAFSSMTTRRQSCYFAVELDATIMSKVKDEKLFGAEVRKVLKAKKYGDKESAKDIAFSGTI